MKLESIAWRNVPHGCRTIMETDEHKTNVFEYYCHDS